MFALAVCILHQLLKLLMRSQSKVTVALALFAYVKAQASEGPNGDHFNKPSSIMVFSRYH